MEKIDAKEYDCFEGFTVKMIWTTLDFYMNFPLNAYLLLKCQYLKCYINTIIMAKRDDPTALTTDNEKALQFSFVIIIQ